MTDYLPTLTLDIQDPDAQKNYQVVAFHGDMDKAGLGLVKDKLESLVSSFHHKYLVFDFSALNFINSESIGFLMALHSHLVKESKNLVIISASEHVKDVLSVIGILAVITYHDNLDTFKNHLS